MNVCHFKIILLTLRQNNIFNNINQDSMKVVDFSESKSIISKYVAELRDVNIQKDRMRFRQNVVRIGHCMAYEISKSLEYRRETIKTPLGEVEVDIPSENIVLATVFRAGLPLHQGFLDVFSEAGNAFVSAYRYYEDHDATKIGIKIEYLASPDLTGKTLIIVDPMLATGNSFETVYKALLTKGTPKRLIMASVIASREGVEYLENIFPDDDIVLYSCCVDPLLNEHKYIVPGLGDAGDLMYGERV